MASRTIILATIASAQYKRLINYQYINWFVNFYTVLDCQKFKWTHGSV